MKIPIRIVSDMLEVDAYAICNKYNKRGPVTFIIDTGSPISSLGEKDVMALGLDVKDFPHYTGTPIGGIGGKAVTYVIEEVTLVLGIVTGSETFCPNETLYYHKGREYRKTVRKEGKVYERESLFRTPSILGTDMMKKYGMVLHLDFKAKEYYLEYD